jgi:nucleoid-associated protein YgaU
MTRCGRGSLAQARSGPADARPSRRIQGNSLSKISKRFYGDANRDMKIFDASKDQLHDPNKVAPGQVLKIPAA